MRIVKTYQSFTYGNFGVTLEQPSGVSRYISFGGGNRYLNQFSTYTTSDKALQDLLEKAPYFNKYYTIKSIKEIQDKEDIIKQQERFQKVYLKNNTAARVWFKENLPDVAVSYLRNQQAFTDKAKEYGYTIIFENAETPEE